VSVSLLGLLLALLALGCGSSGDPFAVFDERVRLPVLVVNPPDKATGVSVQTLITVAFPVELRASSVHRGTFNLVSPRGAPVSRAVSYDASSRVVTIRPDLPLAANSIYQVVIQGVLPAEGTFVFDAATFTFGTGATLASGAPEVVAVTPVPDQVNVNVASNIVISFSEPMDVQSVSRAFSISAGIDGTLSFDATQKILTFDPGSDLPLGVVVALQISSLATDQEGVSLKAPFSSSFRTPIPGSFKVVRSTPADGGTTAAPGDLLSYTFSEPVNRTTIATNFLISSDLLAIPTPTDANFSYANNDQQIFYDPRPTIPGFVGFPGGSTTRTTFTVDVLSALSGIGLEREYRTQFGVEQNPPQVAQTSPQNGSTNVPAQQIIRVTFNEPINRATVNSTSFSVAQGPVVTGTLSFDDGDRTVVFTPNSDLQNVGVPVTVTASTAITDLGGTPLAANFVLSFSVDNSAPFLTNTFPLNGATQVPVTLVPNRHISLTFNEDLDQAATQASFVIAPDGTGGQIVFSATNQLTYTPPAKSPPVNVPAAPNSKLLTANTAYTVTLTAVDLAGNGQAVTLSFQSDAVAPTAIGSPSPSTTETSPLVSVTFSEIMDKDSILTVGAVKFRQTTPALVEIPVALAVTDTGFSFTPTTPLIVGRNYEVVVDNTVTDLGGNPMAAPLTTAFTVLP
jgi:hypothetical protein